MTGGSLQAYTGCNMVSGFTLVLPAEVTYKYFQACNGDAAHYCGGPYRLELYKYNGQVPPPTDPGPGPGPGGVGPVTSGLPGTWHYAACYMYVYYLNISIQLQLSNMRIRILTHPLQRQCSGSYHGRRSRWSSHKQHPKLHCIL